MTISALCKSDTGFQFPVRLNTYWSESVKKGLFIFVCEFVHYVTLRGLFAVSVPGTSIGVDLTLGHLKQLSREPRRIEILGEDKLAHFQFKSSSKVYPEPEGHGFQSAFCRFKELYKTSGEASCRRLAGENWSSRIGWMPRLKKQSSNLPLSNRPTARYELRKRGIFVSAGLHLERSGAFWPTHYNITKPFRLSVRSSLI
jgi:hypothetical protein